MLRPVLTERAPKPVGPYSQAIDDGAYLFVSGQGPLDPLTGRYEPADIATETRRVLENLRAILEAGGSSVDRVVRVAVYLRDIGDFAAMNEVYAAFFGAHRPARTTIQAGALPGGIGVEIDCIARK
jgi:2-iminobutanoate/2-iminopropanoate deaminase